MTDFISELEAELLDAARRRAERGRRRFRWTLPRLAPLATAAALALVAVVIVMGVRALDGPRPADEAPAPTGSGTPVTVPAMVPAEACEGSEPKQVEAVPNNPFSVFSRQPTDAESGGSVVQSVSWIPAETVYPKASRLAGPGHFAETVHLIPVSGLRGDCDKAPGAPGLGVCIAAGADELTYRCFIEAAIVRGAAIARAGEGLAYGMVPDGVARVHVEWDGGSKTVEVMDNAYELRAPGLPEEVRVRFVRSSAPSVCGPSDEALAAVPLLASEATGAPPEPVVQAMRDAGARGAWRDHARATEGGDGLQIWAMPDLPCDNPRVKAERVCIVLVGRDANRGFFCARTRDIAARGAWFPFPDEEGRTGVAGMAPTGTAGAATALQGGQSTTIPITGGVFAAVLPAGSGRLEVRFADGPDLTILNGTRTARLATEVGERLPGRERVDNHIDQQVEHTTVYHGHEDGRPVAEHIAGILRVDRVEPLPEELADLVDGNGLVVVLGRDMTAPRPDDVGVLGASGDVSAEAADRLRERLALGGPLHLFPTAERRARSVVLYVRGWEGPARDIARRLGIDAQESGGAVTPDERLGTPIVVVMGSDLSG